MKWKILFEYKISEQDFITGTQPTLAFSNINDMDGKIVFKAMGITMQ